MDREDISAMISWKILSNVFWTCFFLWYGIGFMQSHFSIHLGDFVIKVEQTK